jgi:hypothetical protein
MGKESWVWEVSEAANEQEQKELVAGAVRVASLGVCEAELWVVDFQPGLNFEQTFLIVLSFCSIFKLKNYL